MLSSLYVMQFAMQQCVIIEADRQNHGLSSLPIKESCLAPTNAALLYDAGTRKVHLIHASNWGEVSCQRTRVQVTHLYKSQDKYKSMQSCTLQLYKMENTSIYTLHTYPRIRGVNAYGKKDPARLHQSTSMLMDLVGNLFLAEICSTPFSSLARIVEGSQSLARKTSRLNLPILLSYLPLDDKAVARVTGFHGKYRGNRQQCFTHVHGQIRRRNLALPHLRQDLYHATSAAELSAK